MYYSKCVSVNPSYGPAWLNWGSSLAESNDLPAAEAKFAAATVDPEVAIKAGVNLGLVKNIRANQMAVKGDLEGAERTLRGGVNRLRMICEGATEGERRDGTLGEVRDGGEIQRKQGYI